MPTILVIDDDRQTCQLIKQMLELDGYTVKIALDVGSAWGQLKKELPDLICCDLLMPEVSGFDFFARRREISGLVDVPVIAITGNYPQFGHDAAQDLGAFDYLIKPFTVSELRSVVESALNPANE